MARSVPPADGPSPGDAVEENAVTLWRTWSAWEGVDCVEERERSYVVSDIPHAAFNHLYRIRLEQEWAVPFLRGCLEPFRERSVPAFCWLDPATSHHVRGELEEAGLEYSFTAPGMILKLDDLDPVGDLPRGLAIGEVRGAGELQVWCDVIGEAASFPPRGRRAWEELHAAIPYGPGEARRHFLARLDGEPVGTSSLLFAAGAAGLFSVVVLPAYRRRGIGTVLSSFTLHEARSAGAAVGTLVSTTMGAGIYRRLGFIEVRRWEGWLWSRCPGGDAVL